MRRDWERDFVDYVGTRSAALRRTAYLLCGDWHHAEDLVQSALAKLYAAWRRIDRTGSVDSYARRTLLRTYLDERRRPWRHEYPTRHLPEEAASGELTDERLVLLAALRALPPSQRAVVVLRYWEDLSVADTAACLRISEGTVKSASARGLAALREGLQGSRTDEPLLTTRKGV